MTAEQIAAVLPNHVAGMGALPQQRGMDAQRGGLRCSCGEWSASLDPGETIRPWAAFYRHVAAALLPLLDAAAREAAAKAWDEGWCAGVSRFTQRAEPPKDNPYRVPAGYQHEPGCKPDGACRWDCPNMEADR